VYVCRILIIVQRCVFFYFFVCLLGMFLHALLRVCMCACVGLSTPLLTSSGFVFWLVYRLRSPSVWVSGRWWGACGNGGKWAVYEEGGDRAIMGGGSEFSLLCLFSFSDCGGGGGEAFR
jgi:hypothetical protein